MIFLFLVKPAFAQNPLYWEGSVPYGQNTYADWRVDKIYVEPTPRDNFLEFC